MPRIRHFILAAFGFTLLASEASAQEVKMQAEVLFRQGREALARGDTAQACDMLSRSNDLDPAPGTQLNLGECELQRGRIATAYLLFRAVEQRLDPGDVRAPIAKGKREAAELRLPRLLVSLPDNSPAGTRVYIGGRAFAVEELREPLIVDPGSLELTITAPGLRNHTMQVLMEEGKTTSAIVAPLVSNQASAQPAAPTVSVNNNTQLPRVPENSTAAVPQERSPTATSRTGTVFLGIGIGGCVLGAVSGILTLDAKRTNTAHCDEATSSCDSTGRDAANRGQVMSALTTTGLAIGAIGVGVGTYLLLQKDTDRRATTSLSLQTAGSGSTLTFQQSF